MEKFVIASNNKGKIREFKRILSAYDIETVSQREAGCNFEVEETGTTFEENAYLKAAAVTKATGLPAIADDSGLMVDFLDGAPGVYSARYCGENATDRERWTFLLKNMEGAEERGAKFVSCICCIFPNGDVLRARGECPGSILYDGRGDHGFGYDPVFQPDGMEKSMAELNDDEKNAISHRGNALRIFEKELREYYVTHK